MSPSIAAFASSNIYKMSAAGAASSEEQIVGESSPQQQVVYDDLGSPIDTSIVNVKRLRVFGKPTPALSYESSIPVVTTGLSQATTEASQLNLMSNVVTCDEGMSPLIEQFSKNFSRIH